MIMEEESKIGILGMMYLVAFDKHISYLIY